jgi:hypothetical protein
MLPAAHDGLPPVPVGIILYVNRSGSTLLSRRLSEALPDVFVFPELRFTLDLLAARHLGRPVTHDALVRLMADDPRLGSLGLHAGQIAAAAQYGAEDLHGLLAALATAALGRRPAAMILKLESYLPFIAALDDAFNHPVLIHAIRDPRAVARSMRATPVPEKPGFDMARGSLFYPARHWRDYVARVATIAARRPVITVRYEADPSLVMVEIARALGVPVTGGGRARFAVAPIDAAIHNNIDGPFQPALGEQWRRDLSMRDIALIETLCGAEMKRAGYPPIAPRPLEPLAMILARTAYLVATARHALRTAWVYARRSGGARRLLTRLRLARAARR